MNEPPGYTNFQLDLQTLKEDANTYNNLVQTIHEKDMKAYQDALEALNIKQSGHVNPEALLLAYSMLVGEQGSAYQNDVLGMNASILKIQGDLNKCSNDIETLETMTSDTSTGAGSVLDCAARAMSQMCELLDAGNTGSNQDAAHIQNALGSSASSSLFGSMTANRALIYDSHDPDQKYNPALPATPPGHTDARTSIYFDVDVDNDPNGKNYYISSFGELNKYMKQSGDFNQATEAQKALTDKNNMFNSTVSSAQASSQEIIQNQTKSQQSWVAFIVDIFHARQSTISASIQAMGKASS